MDPIAYMELTDTLDELVRKIDALISGPINQAGPFDSEGMGPISQVIGDEYTEALRVLRKYHPGHRPTGRKPRRLEPRKV